MRRSLEVGPEATVSYHPISKTSDYSAVYYITWPVNLLVAAHSTQSSCRLCRTGQSEVAQSTVPASALLLTSALSPLLLTLEVRLGEGLHGGQQPHLAHLPAQGD